MLHHWTATYWTVSFQNISHVTSLDCQLLDCFIPAHESCYITGLPTTGLFHFRTLVMLHHWTANYWTVSYQNMSHVTSLDCQLQDCFIPEHESCYITGLPTTGLFHTRT